MFWEEKLSQAGKKSSKVSVTNLCTQTHFTVLKTELTAKVNRQLKCLLKEKTGIGLCLPNTSKF